MNVVKLKHEVCYQTYEVGILHHSFLKNFVEIFLNSIFSSLSLKLKTKHFKYQIFKTINIQNQTRVKRIQSN